MKLNGILVDATLYRYDTDNGDEAFYLAAIFNSTILDELIKPVQSRGQFGPRDIHKKPLEFSIPRYNPVNKTHRKLAELGKEATRKAYEVLPDVLRRSGYDTKLAQRGFLMPQEVGRVRSAIREALNDVIDEIDSLVVKLFEMSSRNENSLLK